MQPSDSNPSSRVPAKRRIRDRLISREGTDNETLMSNGRLRNHVLLADDDLRETAQVLGDIESFLVKALQALEEPDLDPSKLETIAMDASVTRDTEYLEDSLSNLRRRLFSIAAGLR